MIWLFDQTRAHGPMRLKKASFGGGLCGEILVTNFSPGKNYGDETPELEEQCQVVSLQPMYTRYVGIPSRQCLLMLV